DHRLRGSLDGYRERGSTVRCLVHPVAERLEEEPERRPDLGIRIGDDDATGAMGEPGTRGNACLLGPRPAGTVPRMELHRGLDLRGIVEVAREAEPAVGTRAQDGIGAHLATYMQRAGPRRAGRRSERPFALGRSYVLRFMPPDTPGRVGSIAPRRRRAIARRTRAGR